MSDEPLQIVAKLKDDKSYSLAPFIDYFIDRGFHVTAYRLKKEELPKYLQTKLIEGENFFYTPKMSGMFNEQFFLGSRAYEFNIDNYKNIYLPNKEDIVLDVYPDQGNRQAYLEIEITDPNNESFSYEFKVGLVDTFLFGRLLVITIMNCGSKRLVKSLGYDESETDSITFILSPIIFKYYQPLKVLNTSVIGHRDAFYNFFIEDDKDIFKVKFLKVLSGDKSYFLRYYNKSWEYQEYFNIGVSNQYGELQYYEILLYQKYADNFNCPKPVLDKAWKWYRESGYTFMEEN